MQPVEYQIPQFHKRQSKNDSRDDLQTTYRFGEGKLCRSFGVQNHKNTEYRKIQNCRDGTEGEKPRILQENGTAVQRKRQADPQYLQQTNAAEADGKCIEQGKGDDENSSFHYL